MAGITGETISGAVVNGSLRASASHRASRVDSLSGALPSVNAVPPTDCMGHDSGPPLLQ